MTLLDAVIKVTQSEAELFSHVSINTDGLGYCEIV